MKQLFSALMLLACLHLPADVSKDSLLRIIKGGKGDAREARAWASLAFAITWNQPDSILLCGHKAVEFGEKEGNDTAVFYGWSAIASAHYITGQYKKGIEAGMNAYRLAQKHKNEDWTADISNTLGFIHNGAGKYKEAVPFFETSIAYNRKLNDRRALASSLNNLANAYMFINETRRSLSARFEAIAIRKELGLPLALADSYNDLGETYLMASKPDSAFKYFRDCFLIKEKYNDVEMMALSGLNLGRVLNMLKRHKEALGYLQTAERCAMGLGSNQYLYMIYHEMSRALKSLGKTEEAYALLEKHIQYKDSVLSFESQRQLNELSEQFQSEKKTMEIENLKRAKQQDDELANERDKRKNTVLFLSALLLLAIGVYTFLLFKRFKLTREQKRIIELQKHLVEEKQKEILDSIHYARRIQRSLITNEKYIHARLTELRRTSKPSA